MKKKKNFQLHGTAVCLVAGHYYLFFYNRDPIVKACKLPQPKQQRNSLEKQHYCMQNTRECQEKKQQMRRLLCLEDFQYSIKYISKLHIMLHAALNFNMKNKRQFLPITYVPKQKTHMLPILPGVLLKFKPVCLFRFKKNINKINILYDESKPDRISSASYPRALQ